MPSQPCDVQLGLDGLLACERADAATDTSTLETRIP